MSGSSVVDTPILIVGAGISGLLLSQVLKKNGIPFRLIERKESVEAGGAGWGFTINWSLASLMEMLPPSLVDRFKETYVDQEAVARGEDATFPFFDLHTAEMKYEVPRNHKRVRVNRDKLRRILMTDIEVEWSKGLKSIDVDEKSGIVSAHLDDGSSISTHLLVGCDGTHSRVRRTVFPDGWKNKPVPANMLGMTVAFNEEQVKEIRKLDSYFLHGTDNINGVYFWFSLLDVPTNHASGASDEWRSQILISWPSAGLDGNGGYAEIPEGNSDRHTFMRLISKNWTSPFGSLMQSMSESVEIKRVILDDWIYQYGGNGVHNGQVILMGDSGHTMTMYRGEGANHAIADVHEFSKFVVSSLAPFKDTEMVSSSDLDAIRQAAKTYEQAMFQRSWIAVLASRQATVDAHQWDRITEQSPLVAKRQKFLHEVFDADTGILAA